MKLTSTKREFIRLGRRFRVLRNVRAHASFEGVLQPSFTNWIQRHWGFHASGLFRPAAKDFYKQKLPFTLPHWPQSRRVVQSGYTFSPVIQLTHTASNSTSKFLEINGPRLFQTWPTLATTVQINSVLARDRGVQTTQQMNGLGNVVVGKQTESLRSTQREILRNGQYFKSESERVHEFVSSLFSTAFRSVERTAQYLFTVLGHLPSVATSLIAQRPGRTLLIKPLQSHLIGGSLTALNRIEWLKTTPTARRLEQSFLILSNRFQIGGDSEYRPNLSTTVALNFFAPKVGETEAIDRRLLHFISSPTLTYAKREQNFSEGIIQALQALRASQAETKVVMPQLPSIERLTSEVRTQLERELRIERERRGL